MLGIIICDGYCVVFIIFDFFILCLNYIIEVFKRVVSMWLIVNLLSWIFVKIFWIDVDFWYFWFLNVIFLFLFGFGCFEVFKLCCLFICGGLNINFNWLEFMCLFFVLNGFDGLGLIDKFVLCLVI